MQSEIGTKYSRISIAKHVSHFFTVVSPFHVKGDRCVSLWFLDRANTEYVWQIKWTMSSFFLCQILELELQEKNIKKAF